MVLFYKAFKANQVENITFNKQFFYICIDIKHTFSIFKAKPKEFNQTIIDFYIEKKYKFAYIEITISIILNTILIDLHNK